MKLIIMPNNKDLSIYRNADAYLLGIDGLSVNQSIYFKMDEIKSIAKELKDSNKELFISLNKNMHNNDLKYLKEVLLELNDIDITGVFFYDVSIVNLKEKLNLNYDLVWNQEHFSTNYSTCNYWYSKGVNYVCLSNEITLREIKEIIDNTKMKTMVMLYGYIPMFTSKRKIINNYKNYFNINDNFNNYKIYKEGNYYPIINDKNVTTVYSSKILNGIEELDELNKLDYVLINSYGIDDNKIKDVIDCFKNRKVFFDENNDKGFLYKETVYKVK